MILSMTGYGKAEYLFAAHKTIVEIRSVNSKQLDLSLKMASLFRDKEPEVRAMLQKPLERGKVDVTIYTQSLEATEQQGYTPVNWDAVSFYVNDYIQHLSLGLPVGIHQSRIPCEVMAAILRFPDVLKPAVVDNSLSDEEWALLQQAVKDALAAYNGFRQQEGLSLQQMFEDKLSAIEALLAEVEPYETSRVDKIRDRLIDNLTKLSDGKGGVGNEKVSIAYDKNRLEAEMIYYLEKLDINEEKVRLRNHIRYFRETMANEAQLGCGESGVGKKLGFVAQEMGREINTLGSKSNQSEMQIIVVKMKDILEQIKEQVLNVL